MYRGTTPLLILNLSTAIDWAEVEYLEVTLKDDTSHAVKLDKAKWDYDSTNKRLVAQLTQANTLGLSGKCRLQMRYQLKNGLTYASNIATLSLGSILDNSILGSEDINTNAGNFDNADVTITPDESDETASINVEQGTPVVLPSNIKIIAVNGVDQVADAAGRIALTIPLSVSQLSDGQTLLSTVQYNSERVEKNEEDIITHTSQISALNGSLTSLTGRVTTAEADIKTLQNTDKSHNSSIESLQRKTNNMQADVDLAKGNSQAAVTWAREAQATATAAQTTAQTAQTTANNTAAVVETMPKKFKTINGQTITGEGNIEIEAGGGTVQSVSVNGGTPAEPDENGNINLTIEEGGAKEIADLTDGDRVSTLETQMQGKANTSDLNTTNGNVSTLQTKVGQLEQETSNFQEKLIAGDNITIGADGKTISAVGGGSGSTTLLSTRSQRTDATNTAKLIDDEFGKIEDALGIGEHLNELLITDANGYIIMRVGADGLHTTKLTTQTDVDNQPRYFNKMFVAIGDSHTQRYAKWLPFVAKRGGASYSDALQTYIRGDKGANATATGNEDLVHSMLSQAHLLVEKYNEGQQVDVVFIENVHYQASTDINATIPFLPTQVIDLGTQEGASTNEGSWWSTNFASLVGGITPKLGTLVKSKWQNTKYKLTFSGTPIAGTTLQLTIDSYTFSQPISSNQTLADVISLLNSWEFGQYTDWVNTIDNGAIVLTWKGEGTSHAPSVSINSSTCGVSVVSASISTSSTIYRYFYSRNLDSWTERGKWAVSSNFSNSYSGIMGVVEYLLSNISGLEIVMLALPNYSPTQAEMEVMTDDLGVDMSKWKLQSGYVNNVTYRKKAITDVANYYGIKCIDVDALLCAIGSNWLQYYNYGDCHPKDEGYKRWVEIINTELGL